MDFIDFDAFQDVENLPQPQPALSLPISSNIENFGKKFSNLNTLTRSLLKNAAGGTGSGVEDIVEDNNRKEIQLAEKYAAMSLTLLDEQKEMEVKTPAGDENVTVSLGSDAGKGLNARLSRVLSNPISDSNIREIFISLEQKTVNPDEIVEPGIVGTMGRKRLRSDIESDLIKSQSLVLKEYLPAFKNLRNLELKLNNLNKLYDIITENIKKDYESSKDFKEQVNKLTAKRREIALKKSLLSSFKKNFTLSEYEDHLLGNGEINEDFFLALANAERIHENCSILLSSDNPKLGLKIMSKMNSHINKSMERIVQFCNKTFGNLYSLNTKSRLQTLHICLKYLSLKPTYLSSVMHGFTESRSRILVDELLTQINGNLDRTESAANGDTGSIVGGSGSSVISRTGRRRSSTSRPMLLSAHDPVRFIGDLLAYVHSVVVNEIETIDNIFHTNEPAFQSMGSKMVVSILSSLSKPIKSRIDQILSSQVKISTIYSIHNLLDLYVMMYEKQLKHDNHVQEQEIPDSDLLSTIQLLSKTSVERLFSLIRNKLLTIRNSNQAQLEINSLLQPPEWIIEFYLDILPILDNTSSETIMNLDEQHNLEFMKLIVNEPIEIFQAHCKAAAAAAISSSSSVLVNSEILDKRDQLILRGNFLDLILSKITPITLLNDKVLELHETMNKITKDLTALQAEDLYANCGFTNYVNIVNMICPFTDDFFEVTIYQPITENQLFTTEKILEANIKVQDFLPTALMDVQQALLRLNSPITVSEVVTNSSVELVKFYLKFGIIVEEYLKERLLGWSDMEVATLLGVESIYVEEKGKIQLE